MKNKRFIPPVEAAILLLVIIFLLVVTTVALWPKDGKLRAVIAGTGERGPMDSIPLRLGGVPVNLADALALEALPGVGPKTAQAIIAEREENGPFFYPEDLMAVKGIGPKTVEKLRPYLSFETE